MYIDVFIDAISIHLEIHWISSAHPERKTIVLKCFTRSPPPQEFFHSKNWTKSDTRVRAGKGGWSFQSL